MIDLTKKPRVLVAMSGGVDSSVAASLLVEQGYDVVGVTMQVWDYSQDECQIQEGNGTCCSSIDVDDARSVADKLNIPFYVMNCEAKFKSYVIDDFIDSYLKGRTPVPCVNCNTYLKFDHLIQKMHELDCQYLATGHYAKMERNKNNELAIVTSEDGWKDQTYFLFTLDKKVLPHLIFPVGDWKKEKIREYAEEKGLCVARKKDSTGICFIGKKGYSNFIEEQVSKDQLKPGLLKRYPEGEILGEHKGIHHFTYGQRKGLGVADGVPIYVVRIDSHDNTVWLGGEEHLYNDKMIIKNVSWINKPDEDELLKVKIRFHHEGAYAKIEKQNDQYCVNFIDAQRAITPGQAAVFYRGDELLGGGWIL